MQPELIIFLLMVGSFMLSCFAFKLSAGIGMVIAAIVGALAGGMGFPVAQFVEGTFAFLDTILVIAAAMIFMKCIQNSGALDVINRIIIRRLALLSGAAADLSDVRHHVPGHDYRLLYGGGYQRGRHRGSDSDDAGCAEG